MKNKYIALAIILIVLAVAGGLAWYLQGKSKNTNQEQASSSATGGSDAQNDDTAATELPPAEQADATSNNKGTPPVKLSYTEMVKKYEDRRIQFDKDCQARPFDVTYKKGTSLMLDNRSPNKRKLMVDGKTYNLPAFGYVIVPFNTVKQILVDCDTSQNVATILIQQ